MDVERPKMPTSVVVVGSVVGVLVALVVVQWAIGAVLGLLRLGLLVAVAVAVIAVVARLSPIASSTARGAAATWEALANRY